jgi:peptidoglycan hydrolase-like protein with peptidoglycan-binding domain
MNKLNRNKKKLTTTPTIKIRCAEFAASSSRFAVCGFGQKTLNALKVFQADNSLLVDGVYGNESKNKLEGLMQG